MRPDRLARLHAAVDRQAGERVRIVPYTPGGYVAGAPDPSRPTVEFRAPVTAVPKDARQQGTGNTSGHDAKLRLTSHTVKFMTSALPYALARGDRVLLLDQGGLALKVAGTDPFGTDRTVAHLEPLPQVAT